MKSIPETRAVVSAQKALQKNRPDRRQNILDASQRLFARLGYHAVTIRQIAEEAQVPLALVGYYFGQKQELYDAIFGHWAGTLDDRRAGLRSALTAGDGDLLSRIVEAMVLPLNSLRETPQGESYALLVTRGLTQQSIEEDRVIREYFDPLASEFIEAMHQALLSEFPGVTHAHVAWCFQFALGSLLHYVSDQRVERLSKGVNMAADPAVLNHLQVFIVSGIRGAVKSFVEAPVGTQSARAETRDRMQATGRVVGAAAHSEDSQVAD